MWQKLTELSRKAILIAQNQAEENRSDSVCVAHLTYGVLSCEIETMEFDFGNEMSRDEQNAPCGVVKRLMRINDVDVFQLSAQLKALMTHDDGVEGVEPRLTRIAKRVLELAANEARRAKSNYIGPEHLLLGALRFNSPVAALLNEHNLVLATVRVQLNHQERILPEPDKIVSDELQTVLENSQREAMLSGCGQVYSAHLLLAVLGDESVNRLLQRCGTDITILQERVKSRLVSDRATAASQTKYSRVAKRVLDLARQKANSDLSLEVRSLHLLMALSQRERSLASRCRNLIEPAHANENLNEFWRHVSVENLRENLPFSVDEKARRKNA